MPECTNVNGQRCSLIGMPTSLSPSETDTLPPQRTYIDLLGGSLHEATCETGARSPPFPAPSPTPTGRFPATSPIACPTMLVTESRNRVLDAVPGDHAEPTLAPRPRRTWIEPTSPGSPGASRWHLVAKVNAVLGQLQGEVREPLDPRVHVAPKALLAAVARIRSSARLCHSIFSSTKLQAASHSRSLKCSRARRLTSTQQTTKLAIRDRQLPWTPPDLHVLLRHRLLLEAELGEREVALEVGNMSSDFAVLDVEQVRSARRHLPEVQPARSAVPAGVSQHQHALAIKLAVLLGLEPDIL